MTKYKGKVRNKSYALTMFMSHSFHVFVPGDPCLLFSLIVADFDMHRQRNRHDTVTLSLIWTRPPSIQGRAWKEADLSMMSVSYKGKVNEQVPHNSFFLHT